ncbi:FAD/NAD(P)-binding protein [Streptomyces acidiscabies]|uniref:FAD/NAD(P)-binding protein n=1 Tax=Streptomyces acidiscabies TaxID=42234 RepID=UPI003EB9184C
MGSELRVGIIGLGSRGCSILERVISLARNSTFPFSVRVDIVDPTSSGQGLHATDQPDYLLLNTLCGEISMFPGPESVGAGTAESGPGLFDGVTARGLRLAEDGHTVTRTGGRAIVPGDFLPRRILGEYLRWFFEWTCRRAPEGMRIHVHRSEAVDVESREETGVRITLADGTVLTSDYVFLTLGHVGNDRRTKARAVTDPYPLPESVEAIGPGDSVAVGGFGLSAMDVVAALTLGRGGRFSRRSGGIRYLPGGAEPRILLYSRSGIPFRVRPKREEMTSRFQPMALTREAVAALRSAGPLDFDEQLMPLMLNEMRIAYVRCRTLGEEGPEAEEKVTAYLAEAVRSGNLPEVLDEIDGSFDPTALWDPSENREPHDSHEYQEWLTRTVRDDLTEAEKGLSRSPVKAAAEAVREVRDILRDAVNFRGLTSASLDAFMSRTVPLMNRAVVGPQKERYAELLALADSGIVRFPFGAAPRIAPEEPGPGWTVSSTRLEVPYRERVDWLCAGNAPWPDLATSASPLVRSLRRRRLLTSYAPGSGSVGAADVDPSLHPVGPDGTGDPRLWLIGPLCEGATFYNHLIPTPGYSRAFVDAHRCVTEMYDQFTQDEQFSYRDCPSRADRPTRSTPNERARP